MTIATLVRGTRRAQGLSQRELARLSREEAPTISQIENGHRIPRVDTLDRLLRAAGSRLGVLPTTRAGALEVSVDIREALADGDESRAFRSWLTFSDGLGDESPAHRVVLTAAAPEPTGSALYDAALAATAAHWLAKTGAPEADWIARAVPPARPTVLTDSRYVTSVDPRDVPPAFLARNVLVDASTLEAA